MYGKKFKTFGSYSFQDSGLRALRISRHVRTIGERAFSCCCNLRALKFSKNARLEEICEGAFLGTPLREFVAPTSLRVLCAGAFCGGRVLGLAVLNEGLEILGQGTVSEDDDSFQGVFESSGLEEVALPSTLRQIGPCAFRGCDNLRSVVLPEGLERIDYRAFFRSGLEDVLIPRSVLEIAAFAFAECVGLGAVHFEQGSRLRLLGSGAFEGSGLC